MKPTKTEKKDNQETKPNNEEFPDFNGRLDLILKIISILINFSISENQFLDLNKKKELIKKYDDMLRAAKNEFSLNLQGIISKEFLNEIIKDFHIFNQNLLPFLKSALSSFTKFQKNEINVGNLMDNLIHAFGGSITYVKNNNGKNLSFELSNEFYSYLDDISKRAKDLKQLSSKTKTNEEIKINEKEESEQEYFSKIETLKKILKEKEKELILDLGTYKEMNQNANRIIEEKNKSIDDYKGTISRIEQN